MSSPRSLLGTEETAAIIGIGRSTVNAWAASGRLEPYAVIGEKGVLAFERSYIEDFAARERERREHLRERRLARARARRARA